MKKRESKAMLYLIRKVRQMEQQVSDMEEELNATQEIIIRFIEEEEKNGTQKHNGE